MQAHEDYGTNCSISINDDFSVSLDQVTMLRTYAGWMVGAPNTERNRTIFDQHRRKSEATHASIANWVHCEPECYDYCV